MEPVYVVKCDRNDGTTQYFGPWKRKSTATNFCKRVLKDDTDLIDYVEFAKVITVNKGGSYGRTSRCTIATRR